MTNHSYDEQEDKAPTSGDPELEELRAVCNKQAKEISALTMQLRQARDRHERLEITVFNLSDALVRSA